MDSELERMAAVARQLAAAVADRPELASRSARLAERLVGGRFHISVLGEFKRGKSTLVNALLGLELMPTGVLPLTSVATEVAYGPERATVVFLDGGTEEIGPAQLVDYVTEAGNPGNERRVGRVEVRVPVELLRPGVVLVDTPGIGSVYHHDVAAARAVMEADGAILVLSADAPLSQAEHGLLATMAAREAPAFYVLNRVDHLSATEREEVARFVEAVMEAELGRVERLWCVSARAALRARLAGATHDQVEGGDFAAFADALSRFVERDLVQARLGTGRAELARLAHELEGSLAIEAATTELDAATLAQRVARMRGAAAEQRQAFEDERTLLGRDVAALEAAIGRSLSAFATDEPSRHDQQLVDVASSAPVGKLEDALRGAVQSAVLESFEQYRLAEAARAEESWRRLAERFRDRTQERVDAVRTAAADIFKVELPRVPVPEVAEERERYFHLFLHVGTSTEGVDRLVRRLLPPATVRRRLLEQARRELAEEFDKHAGRAHWDLAQRLGSVRQRFEAAMEAELDRSVGTILAATARAEELREQAEVDRRQHRQRDDAARRAVGAALSVSVWPEGARATEGRKDAKVSLPDEAPVVPPS